MFSGGLSMSFGTQVNRIHPNTDLSAMSDDSLLAAAQSGQERAFVELCARHSKRVFHMIYNVTKNREDAEDAMQDSLLRAFRSLKQFDGRSSFATWFTRIGINSALMILRKKRVRPETATDFNTEVESWGLPMADHSADPEENYAACERAMHLRQAICQLPTSLRSVVEMRQLQGHSIKQTAHNMGISIQATKSRMVRARAALRDSMT
jgi:RNA polymerase sigma factor (sigma-70 family)